MNIKGNVHRELPDKLYYFTIKFFDCDTKNSHKNTQLYTHEK